MNDALDGTERLVSDRIAAFLRARKQFRDVGDELPRDRVAGIVWINQGRHRRRHADGVGLPYGVDLRPPRLRRKTRVDKVGGSAER